MPYTVAVNQSQRGSNMDENTRPIKHGGARRGKEEPLYKIWRGVKSRCYTKSHHSYAKYGEKGISMCDEWKNDYNSFRTWALANGFIESLHLDKDELCKEKDISPHIYSPDTCQWIMQHKNNVIESQLQPNEVEYAMVQEYIAGISLKELANKYYIGIGQSISAPTKYVSEVMRRYGVYKPKQNRATLTSALIEQIIKDDRPISIKLQQYGISKSKWHRSLTKYKQEQV